MPRRSILSALLALTMLVGFAPQPAVASARTTMVQLTNEDRAENDRDPLRLDRRLSRYAERHSAKMARRGELFHTHDLGKVLGGRRWSRAGENVGYAASLEQMQEAFMNSPLHRENLLSDEFDRIAVGVRQRGGMKWVTVIFYG